MLRTILIYGLTAGVLVAAPMCYIAVGGSHATQSLAFGYLVMLLVLSLIFVGVKRYRDRALGGVIRFLPALLIGLGISALASVIYAIGWEITTAITHNAFADSYAASMVQAARAKGG